MWRLMKTIVIIQARMGSSRLPGKILKPLGKKDVLSYVVERCEKIVGVSDVVVATSTLAQDDIVEEWCKQKDIAYFRGSEEHVLSRYAQAAERYNPDYVIRVTADCPYVDFQLASEMIRRMEESPSDFIKIGGELPRGLAVELFSFTALKYIEKHGKEQRHKEHVTYYAYENNHEFSWSYVALPQGLSHPHLRITLDTEEDYELCQQIAEHFKGDLLVPSEEVVRFLLDHPEIAKINAHIEQKPVV